MFLREAGDPEDAAIDQFRHENDLVAVLCLGVQGKHDIKSVSESGLAFTLTLMLMAGALSRA